MIIANQILRSILAMWKKLPKNVKIQSKKKYIYIRSDFFHKSFFTNVRANSQKIGLNLCVFSNLQYIDNRNIRGFCLCKDGLNFSRRKEVLANNFSSFK